MPDVGSGLPDPRAEALPLEHPATTSGVGIGAALPQEGAVVQAQGMEDISLSQWQLAWRRLRRHKIAMVSLVVFVLIGLACAFAGVLSKYGYADQNLLYGLHGPSLGHIFGTDELGRDQFARLLYGGRISLLVALGVAFSSGIIGTFIGSISGFYGGRLDNFLMRTTDLFLAIPLLVITIIAATILGGSVLDIVIVLSLFFWMPVARIVRGVFMSLKEKEYVEAARAAGASNWRIMFSHLLPNSLGPIIVNVTLSVAAAILTESALSFLGFGVRPPTPTWGNMLADSRTEVTSAPWLIWVPGIAILVTVLAVNFLGDGLRDALDPTQQRVRA
jgi:peptide/nickel transport system permease protein